MKCLFSFFFRTKESEAARGAAHARELLARKPSQDELKGSGVAPAKMRLLTPARKAGHTREHIKRYLVSMSSKKDFILANYSGLLENEQVFGRACYCGKTGGRCSLGVKKEKGVLLYNCFSAGCELGRGRATLDAFEWTKQVDLPPVEKELTHELPEGFIRYLPQDAVDWLEMFGITEEEQELYDIGYWPEQDRVVVPIYTQGKVVSWQARSLTGAIPKWLTPKGGTGDSIFTSQGCSGRIGVLVEDTISCIRVGRLFPCVAALGTHITAAKSRNISNWYREKKLDKLIILLDDDAYKKAMGKVLPALNRHSMRIKVIKAGLGKDPKAMTDNELKELIK